MKSRIILTTIAAATLIGACSSGAAQSPAAQAPSQAPTPSMAMSHEPSTSPSSMAAATSMTPACDLRVGLGSLLGEHTILAAAATQQGLTGPEDEFMATAAQLDENTVALGAAIQSVYGDEAEAKFLELWRAHIGFFVDYTVATAKGDDAGKTKAATDLDGYRRDFDAFLTGANPKLPAGAVEEALKPHVAGLAGQVDAYFAKDYTKAYGLIDEGFQHATMLGATIAEAIVQQFPDKFGGAAATSMTPACDLRVGLGSLLGEHTILAAAATQQGLTGPEDEFMATAAQLDENTVALGAAIQSVYGDEAEAKFLELWRAHIGFFVDYTVATAKGDDAGKTKAATDLDGYRRDFDAFLTGANPKLPAGAVEEALKPHVAGLAGQVDAYFAKDYTKAYGLIDEGFQHATMLGATIAEAIVQQFPDKFGN